ncbi:MAG TPA: GtrA family protein [Sphingomicrobium sp.]|nr:GtrA family protein [Sphingomicrobium sp.]
MMDRLAREEGRLLEPSEVEKPAFLVRLLSRRVGAMLVRNTVVSTGVFLLGLALLWFLVSRSGMNEIVASGISFIFANTLHYVLGRTWIFRGTTRGLRLGYAFFLANSGVGLIVTVGLFAAFLHFTSIHYLVARVIVSIFAGLAVFVLNAALNFRRV